MEFLFSADRNSYRRMTTSELRNAYMVDSLFVPGEVTLCYTDTDRAVVGSVVPLNDPLTLPVHKELASDFFTQRREIGVVNIGGSSSLRRCLQEQHDGFVDFLNSKFWKAVETGT